tara:strand:+ start:5033 stop:8338 length:3306 start_codon:yes stop_codon:yes gene_type:complete
MAIEFRTRSKAIQPDSEDVGACCTLDETTNTFVCEDNVRYINCKRNLSIFRGKGSVCGELGDNCPSIVEPPILPLNSDLHGACKTCSSCTDNLLVADCITQSNFDAEFFGGKLCIDVTKDSLSSILDQKYACCIDDGCFDTCNPDYCESLGGVFHNGVGTSISSQCASNPCNNIDNPTNIGACCRAGICIGQQTSQDCIRNNGTWIAADQSGTLSDCSINGNYNCEIGMFTSDTRPPTSEQNSGGLDGASLVCSRPTPKKYYDTSGDNKGKWNGTIGSTYSSEPVWVTLVSEPGQCVGGIISSTDGDINKATMWGGCQYNNGDGWICESKTEYDCVNLEGKWWPGIYCDDIRIAPASGLLYAETYDDGLGEKYLAGSCHIIDSVNGYETTNCGDMKTQYQCFKALQLKRDYYLKVIAAGENKNWTEQDLTARLTSVWRPGKSCTDPSCNSTAPNTDVTLGTCKVKSETNAVYWEGTSNFDYTYHTGRQTVCMDNYTKTDCEILHGMWEASCESCVDQGQTTPVETGSCCTGPDTCLDGKTYLECQNEVGFFHGPGTSCADRDCGKVAFLEPILVNELGSANCKCVVAEEPSTIALRVFARQDGQNENDVWAGSTCGDPTVDAIPYYDETNFAKDTFVLYSTPPDVGGEEGEKYSDSRPIGDLKYNLYNEAFRTFIVSNNTDGSGSFLDDILIQDKQECYFRVDKKEPVNIPLAPETLKSIKGITLETNQPADSITRLILNDPSLYWTGGFGNVPVNRKIKYVNLEGMTNLRQLAIQGFVYEGLRTNFEAQSFPILNALDFSGSTLEGLDLSNSPAIERLNLNNNVLTSLDLSSNIYVTSVDLAYNNLTSLTFATDSIYLTDLKVGYNSQLSSIGGSYPQLETFYAQRCNFSVIDFSKMPFLRDVNLQKNPLSQLNLDKCPSIDYINLDSCINNTSVLGSYVLPSQTNRALLSSEVPSSISGAIIPSPNSRMTNFSFRNNNIPATGYDNFIKKVCETVAITRFNKFNNTIFGSVGTDIGNRTNLSPVYCETIDFSNVTDAVDGGSVKKILEYIFGNIPADKVDEIIKHNKKIRIILTGINTTVDYSDLDIHQAVLNRMTFIN